MNSEQFVSVLRCIGCSSSVEQSSINWMFSDIELIPFLHWFCTEVNFGNVLKPGEFIRHERLQSCEPDTDDVSCDEVVEDELRQEIEDLESSLGALSVRRAVLTRQLDKLTEHECKLSDTVAYLDSESVTMRAAELQLIKQLEKENSHNLESDDNRNIHCMESLTQSVCLLGDQYDDWSKDSSVDDSSNLISHLSLDSFIVAQEKYSDELTNFTKKQFFEGIAEIAKKTDGTRYEFLEVNRPETWLIQGHSDSEYLQNCQDLARVTSMYVSNELMRMRALLDECSVRSAVEFYESLSAKLSLQPLPHDISSLSTRQMEAESVHGKLHDSLMRLIDVRIPELLQQNSTLRVLPVLQGDYELKLTRQQYFTSNQDKLIGELVGQKSHSELMSMMLDIELCEHRDVRRTVSALLLYLQQLHQTFNNTSVWLSERAKACDYMTRSSVDTRDHFILRLHSLLQTLDEFSGKKKASGDRRLFVTYEHLSNIADVISRHFNHHESSSLIQHSDRLSALERCVSNCERVLYDRGEVRFSDVQIEQAMTHVTDLLQTLEQTVVDIMKDIEHKKKILQKDPLLSIERDLYIYFHNDPQRLREIFTEVTSR